MHWTPVWSRVESLTPWTTVVPLWPLLLFPIIPRKEQHLDTFPETNRYGEVALFPHNDGSCPFTAQDRPVFQEEPLNKCPRSHMWARSAAIFKTSVLRPQRPIKTTKNHSFLSNTFTLGLVGSLLSMESIHGCIAKARGHEFVTCHSFKGFSFFSHVFILCVWAFWIHACLCTICMSSAGRSEEGGHPKNGTTVSLNALCWCWGSNPDLLQEQPAPQWVGGLLLFWVFCFVFDGPTAVTLDTSNGRLVGKIFGKTLASDTIHRVWILSSTLSLTYTSRSSYYHLLVTCGWKVTRSGLEVTRYLSSWKRSTRSKGFYQGHPKLMCCKALSDLSRIAQETCATLGASFCGSRRKRGGSWLLGAGSEWFVLFYFDW